MAEDFEVAIRDNFGNAREFHSIRELKKFVDLEEDAWSWIPAERKPNDPGSTMRAGYRNMRTWITQFENNELNQAQFQNTINGPFQGANPQALFSDFSPGANIQLIHEHLGESSGRAAFRMIATANGYTPTSINQTRIWNMIANPGLIKGEDWLADHQRKLAAARANMTKEIAKYEETTEAVLEEAKRRNSEAHSRYRRLARFLIGGAKRRSLTFRGEADNALKEIEATRATYAERMRLEAPVTYWANKSSAHKTTAWKWGIALVVYLLAVSLGIYLSFPQIWEAIEPGEALSGRHFLLVATIGAGLTLIFWMARLIVRIYLGERHLQTDAEERRVMTQAYLALIKESAATNEERIVILSALFRTAQDGIVKEDGAGDISLPAMIARLMDARRT